MRWKEYAHGDYYLTKKFAWFPIYLKDGTVVWFESYWHLTTLIVLRDGTPYWLTEKVYIESDAFSHRACQKLADGNVSTSWW